MDNSGLNTGLLLIIIIALIGGGAWYVMTQIEQEPETNIEVTLPIGNNE